MKILSYLLIPALAFGMFSNKASAQTTSIDWGEDFTNVSVMAGNTESNLLEGSTIYGNVWATDWLPYFMVDIKHGKYSQHTIARMQNDVYTVSNRLDQATSTNTVSLKAATGKNIAGKNSTWTELGVGSANHLKPGIYTFDGDAIIPTGYNLVLDDGGDQNAFYIFRISGKFTSDGNVTMKSGFPGVNVFFQISENVKIHNIFSGNIVAPNNTSYVSLGGTTNITGRIATTGTVGLGKTHINIPTDTDGDGVYDNADDYPLDARFAYNNEATPSIVAFEDQWPSKGDFDFNDLVMKSNYNYVTNANNEVVRVLATYTLLATGGTKKNSFHVHFFHRYLNQTTLVPGSISGAPLDDATEVTFKLFDNMRDEMAEWNTIPGKPVSASKVYNLSFDIQPGLGLTLGTLTVDPFIVNTVGTSVREVHLPRMMQTSKADPSVFGTEDDNQNFVSNKRYTSKDGFPWAISFPADHFDYPVEGKDISLTYPKLKDWVESDSNLSADWYSNKASGYRITSQVFSTSVVK